MRKISLDKGIGLCQNTHAKIFLYGSIKKNHNSSGLSSGIIFLWKGVISCVTLGGGG